MSAATTHRVALLGTGQVARALALRVDALRRRVELPPLSLRQVFNSRGQHAPAGPGWVEAVARQAGSAALAAVDPVPALADEIDVVIDLTASDTVASLHAHWLRQGRVVVTANKRGLGEGHARALELQAAIGHGSDYGDAATVGAGLGALRRLRELRACGERVFEIRGVLSGSLAWLFDHYDGSKPFSELVREAHGLGFTEPDPREDVGGRDVVRKLKILARAAGWPVPERTVELDGHLLVGTGAQPFDDIRALDRGFERLLAQRPDPAARLAVVAHSRPGLHRVGLDWLAADDPLAARSGCDNAVEIRCERYDERPLVLRGPGAGPALTASAVLEDLWGAVAARGRSRQPRRRAG